MANPTKLTKLTKLNEWKSGMAGTSLMTAIGAVLAVMIILRVILPAGADFLGLSVGKTAAAATSIDNGFSNLIQKVDMLESSNASTVIDHAFTVDKGFFVVSFNDRETRNGAAVKPPECEGATCLCVCIDEACQSLDIKRSRGRDCRPLYGYKAVIAQSGIRNNKGGEQVDSANEYVSPDGIRTTGFYFFVAGSKNAEESTVAVKLHKGDNNLYFGK